VFYPSYQLCAVRIAPEPGGGVSVEHRPVEKPSPEELTFAERALTLGRAPDPGLPDPIVLRDDGTVVTPGDGGTDATVGDGRTDETVGDEEAVAAPADED